MVALEMLKNGFEPSRGLGARLHGIVESIPLPGQSNTFGRRKKDCTETPTIWDAAPGDALNNWAFSNGSILSPGKAKKTRKFKTDLSLKIKEEVSKQFKANVIRATKYPTWLANIVPVPKKDGKIRICVDYRDLNKASPKDDFPLPNIHILIDNCAKHELQSFVDCFSGYHQILMNEDDAEKIAFITPWGVYCYRVMPFGLKNAGATYMRAMTTILHDMIHKEIEVYVDDVIIKSRKSSDHLVKEGKGNLGCNFGGHRSIAAGCDDFRPTADGGGTVADGCPLKYIFQKPMPIGKLAKWQILLSEFDIVYVTQKAVKGQALADHLAENPVDEEYKPLRTYFPDEEVLFAGEDISEAYSGWRMFFDGATNFKGVGVGAVLVSESGQHYPISAKLRFLCTNNMVEYEARILGLRMAVDMNIQELLELCKKFIKVDFKHVPRVQNEFADALATLSSMIQHPNKNYIDPIKVNVQDQPAYCFDVDEEPGGESCYCDINRYLKTRDYPEGATSTQKRTLRRLANHFFLNSKILYRRTPNLGLLRCVDAREATKLIEEIHAGTCGPNMNGFTLCQIHGDLIQVPSNELNVTSSPWGMDVIAPIEPATSNGHRFILVAIDYFTKWVEASSYKSVTKKVVADFVRNNIVRRFGILESIITDNGANLNSDLMQEICDKKMIDNYRHWHEKLPFALLRYRTTVRTSTGATPYLLVYGTEAVLPVEVEIPSLRVIQEAKLSNAEWVKNRYEQLMLIDEKIMNVVSHGQLYQNRMARAFNKKVKSRQFKPGQLVLKRIFPHQNEGKGKFAPNWQGPYMVHRVLTGGALILAEMDGEVWPKPINTDAVKRYHI
ncbi:PREDICTED: uncharacterized protein LOC109235872 [Nicotiana attenuata]|uniref:uncharacterized protein LOC109235872 n=1 Tax=Nicotiana attenuata TaxID=49451 RepID=UPI000904DACA|nr:PREDICTED: uncharacterized protein LOC109235872 [Nicotiana attenuata]